MASIYLHIPFCKQACHYCDFHFSTSLKHKQPVVNAICKELEFRKAELTSPVQNIYFGGGTPSLLSETDFEQIFNTIHTHYQIVSKPEITLEANPDDINKKFLQHIKLQGVNRLSLGVQSFFKEDLVFMHRAHSTLEAYRSIELIKHFFDNFSIDLIYGIPKMNEERWVKNLEIALQFEIPHLSCYALTVEPNTALYRFIEKEIIPPLDDQQAATHHQILLDTLSANGYDNYEFSNFCKHGYFSQNNTAYWTGKAYLGIGPSAHSYNGLDKRKWNIAHNLNYTKAILSGESNYTEEILSKTDQYNEYIMTRLRTKWGINLEEIKTQFGQIFLDHLKIHIQPHIINKSLFKDNTFIKISNKAKFFTDGIAADLFKIKMNSIKC